MVTNGFKGKETVAAGGGSGAFVRRRFVLRDPVCRRGTSCRHLQTGECIYSHVPDGGPSGLCKWFAAGRCKFGDACYRRHKIIPSAEEEDFVSACGDTPDEQQPVCVPCEAETEEGCTAMEVGGQSSTSVMAEEAAEVEEKERGVTKEVMGQEMERLEKELGRVAAEAAKWKERALELRGLLKEKEREMERAAQAVEVRSKEVQTKRINYKSVAVGEAVEERALVVVTGGSGEGSSMKGEKRRQAEGEVQHEGKVKKQVLEFTQVYKQHMVALGWHYTPDPEQYLGWCSRLEVDPIRIRREELERRIAEVQGKRSISRIYQG